MASQLIALIAASALMAVGAPSNSSDSAAQKVKPVATGLTMPAAKASAGTCMVPVTKGQVTKLSSIRKARDLRTCTDKSQYMMQGPAGYAPAAPSAFTLVEPLIVVGLAVGLGYEVGHNEKKSDI